MAGLAFRPFAPAAAFLTAGARCLRSALMRPPSSAASPRSVSICASTRAACCSVQQIAAQLGAHVERIEISFLGGRASTADALVRETIRFLRQPNGSYLPIP